MKKNSSYENFQDIIHKLKKKYFVFLLKKNSSYENFEDITGLINDENELKKVSVSNKHQKKFDNWFRSHGNNFNNKYIETIDLDKKNLNNLELVFKFDSIKNSNLKNTWDARIGANPIYANGKIFFITASYELVAISADDYTIIWSRDFESMISKRGFLYHENKDEKFLLITDGNNLYKLNSEDGSLIKSFGKSGSVEVGMVLIPPVIFKNQIILSNITQGKIISLDLETGKKNFSKNLHENNEHFFFANPWGGSALDDANGIYFVVTGNPKPIVVGIERPGDNKNSCSIIAFDINKKKIIWKFQDVSHDLWDFDISAPPIIADINVKDHIFQAVIVTTKTGNTYVFDRKTGKSLFDINYKNVEASQIPNEITAPKQPEPKLPKKFSKLEFKKTDLRDELLSNPKFMENFNEEYTYGWFKPPAIGKDIVFYGLKGGNNWIGSAYNPQTQTLYIPSNHIPYKIKTLVQSKENNKKAESLKNFSLYNEKCASCHGKTRNGRLTKKKGYDIEKDYVPSLVGLTIFDELKHKMKPYSDMVRMHKNKFEVTKEEYGDIGKLFLEWDRKIYKNDNIFFDGNWIEFFADDKKLISKPPWGTITSINLSDGATKWKKPFGFENGKEIGLFNYGGTSITSSNLLVATGTIDNFITIIDAKSGETLWKYKMDAEGTAAPLIYNHKGKSYIASLATGGLYPNSNKASTLYIFGISKKN